MSENWPSKEQEIWFQAGVTGERQRIMNHDDEEGIVRIKADSIQLLVDAAKQETEERIIKLLEVAHSKHESGWQGNDNSDELAIELAPLIALMKGETNV